MKRAAVCKTALTFSLILSTWGTPETHAQTPRLKDTARTELLEALKPPKRKRPVVAVIGTNNGTETTDYLVPYGVLKRANIADVYALGTQPGPLTLMPALRIQPDTSSQTFDLTFPDGADYVIVPAMHTDNDPATIRWIKKQAASGAIIIGICTGAKVLGNVGLLHERQATTHWYDLASVQRANPTMRYVADQRYVVDNGVATTTGITAAIPMSLTLVEAVAGYKHAATIAAAVGATDWGATHDSSAFRTSLPFYLTGVVNWLARWRHEAFDITIEDGVDEIALALTADAWSRTYRSQTFTRAAHNLPVTTLGGIKVLPDRIGHSSHHTQLRLEALPPVHALDLVVNNISRRYGANTANFVALQLEYTREPP